MIDPNPLAHAWNWIEIHTGTADPRGSPAYYNFWSGFGSDLGEVAIIGGVVAMYRKHNCHVTGCWRIARHPVEGTPYIVCRKHHPTVPKSVSVHHIVSAHSAVNIWPTSSVKGPPVSFDLATLETRFHDVEEDAKAALHSGVASALVTAAKAIIPLIPEGSDVEGLLTLFDKAASEAHKLIEAAAPVVDAVAPEAASVVTDAETVTDTGNERVQSTTEAGTPLPPR